MALNEAVGVGGAHVGATTQAEQPQAPARIGGENVEARPSLGRRIGEFFSSIGRAIVSLPERIATAFRNRQEANALHGLETAFANGISHLDVTSDETANGFLRGNDATSRAIANYCKPLLAPLANEALERGLEALAPPDGSIAAAYAQVVDTITHYTQGDFASMRDQAVRTFPPQIGSAIVAMEDAIDARAQAIADARGAPLTDAERANVEQCKKSALANVLLRGFTPHFVEAAAARGAATPEGRAVLSLSALIQQQVNGQRFNSGGRHGDLNPLLDLHAEHLQGFLEDVVANARREG